MKADKQKAKGITAGHIIQLPLKGFKTWLLIKK